MSVFVMKLIAVISMFIDHLSYVLRLSQRLPYGQLYILGRSIGRPAFVIYCFLLVNGFEKTGDRKKYLGRLILFSAISQIPFSLAFSKGNYLAAEAAMLRFDALGALPMLLPLAAYFLYVCDRRFEPSLLWLAAALAFSALRLRLGGVLFFDKELNVYFTLAVSMALMLYFEWLFSAERSRGKALLIAAALGVELYFVQMNADYGLFGVALILALYFCRGSKPLQLVAAALWCVIEYRFSAVYMLAAGTALLPMALYNGRLGPKMRTAFYVFYPVHLALLGAVFVLLARV